MGRRRRGGQLPALRRADGLRRSARRLPGHRATSSSARCRAGWSASRSTPPAAGAAPGAADPRAAHPPGEGDQSTSAPPRCCWPSCRRSTPCTTAPTGCGASPSGSTRSPPSLAAGLRRRRGRGRHTTPSSTRSPCAVPGRADDVVAAAARRRHQPAPRRRRHASASPSTRRPPPPTSTRLFGCFGVPAAVARPRATARRQLPPALRAHLAVPHPPGVHRPPLRDRDAALPAPAGRPRPRPRPVDDPAGLVHHEAQRHRRDGAGDLARFGPHPPLRPARPGRRLPAS